MELDPVRRATIDGEAAGVVSQNFADDQAANDHGIGHDDAVQFHGEHVVPRRAGSHLMNLNGDEVIARVKVGDADGCRRRHLPCGVGDRPCRRCIAEHGAAVHVESRDFAAVDVEDRAVINEVRDLQAREICSCRHVEVRAEVEGHLSKRQGNGGQQRLDGIRNDADTTQTAQRRGAFSVPCGIIVRGRKPIHSRLYSIGEVTPDVRERQQIDQHRRRRRRRRHWTVIWRTRSADALSEVCHAAVRAEARRDSRALRPVGDAVDQPLAVIRQRNGADIGREPEVQVVRRRSTIRDERNEPGRPDEAEFCDAMLLHAPERCIGEIQTTERDGQPGGIVEFHVVLGGRRLTGGEPFVDAQRGHTAERLRDVHRSKRRLAEGPIAVRADAADGEVGQLQTERHGIEQRAAVADAIVEIDRVAARAEREAEMKARCAVGVVRQQRQVGTGIERGASGEGELVRVRRIIRESQAGKVHNGCPFVVQFHGVREGSKMIERGIVAREHFAQAHGGRGGVHHPGLGDGRRGRGLIDAAGVAADDMNGVR